MIQFPLLNITDHDWEPEVVEAQLIFDGFIYVKRELFDEFYRDKFYADCKGDVYKAIDVVPPTALWRRAFYFLPMVYKSKLIFEKTELRLTLDQLRDFVIDRISELPGDNFNKKWIEQLKQAKTHKDIIDGQID
ncbi:MAG: hypothetical protein Roseis2KO_43160 [Roseivirga sp.]